MPGVPVLLSFGISAAAFGLVSRDLSPAGLRRIPAQPLERVSYRPPTRTREELAERIVDAHDVRVPGVVGPSVTDCLSGKLRHFGDPHSSLDLTDDPAVPIDREGPR